MGRLRIEVRGVVQGVGFRPFVARLATEAGFSGWVRNTPAGVEMEVQGAEEALQGFLRDLRERKPTPARVLGLEHWPIPTLPAEPGFQIRPSGASATARPSVPADLALCPDCAAEMDDPRERRHRYPFTNCTNCGPRYSIIRSLPYDRPRTAMAEFPMCEACAAQYREPLDRRYHAQPIACPVCGPRLAWASASEPIAQAEEALLRATQCLLEGQILALKGLGGYQLLVDATSESAVLRLRQRKHREDKPFAVMFPHLASLAEACQISSQEAAILQSSEAPILLLPRKGKALPEALAPGNPNLGAFLPNTPLHRLLLAEVGRPLVCTSGNLAEEPMAIEDGEARWRLGGIADAFLSHDRPILRPVDDSIGRVEQGTFRLLRRARGFAPLPLPIAYDGPPILAFGGHQKSTVTLLFGGQAVVSQHLGDLDGPLNRDLLARTVEDLLDFFQVKPELLACDLHPDYASTHLAEAMARERGLPLHRVQHHHAHAAACAAELGFTSMNEGDRPLAELTLRPPRAPHGVSRPSPDTPSAMNEGDRPSVPLLGLIWDGSGYGSDGTLWGGEALRVEGGTFERIGHLRAFPLPGGERAVREPRRSALGLCWELLGHGDPVQHLFPDREFGALQTMLARGLNAPRTSSMGRLFDAVAALTGVRAEEGFEGQGAMALEFAAHASTEEAAYAFEITQGVADPGPLLRGLLRDRGQGAPVLARRFHNGLADLALAWAQQAGLPDVVLSGGCFQNRLLARLCMDRLAAAGFRVHRPALYPPNDGGISLGQAWVAAQWEKRGRICV